MIHAAPCRFAFVDHLDEPVDLGLRERAAEGALAEGRDDLTDAIVTPLGRIAYHEPVTDRALPGDAQRPLDVDPIDIALRSSASSFL